LNCNSTVDDPSFQCQQVGRACGFTVGRFEWQDNTYSDYSGPSEPTPIADFFNSVAIGCFFGWLSASGVLLTLWAASFILNPLGVSFELQMVFAFGGIFLAVIAAIWGFAKGYSISKE
jgi:hypothetical protein